ncbi:hypothetical protein VC83_01848 [Pseudogymnoascus destructans]|uniref:Uncharacterized protein n=2 Tax=Pseudogymnoascus destructans TaxID=655981 RepID=L8G7L0_PSED2|nr:uncharacterized protein VC83_01848 [Pseudogymnoascus destructans]ELR09210.1 hypothetical protein GMDG_03784 [Pseudogymnoascus destructans 20631-21]OAF61653.1 hypothetical protein VC83_01848 [Pseudogymnoascus destructans]
MTGSQPSLFIAPGDDEPAGASEAPDSRAAPDLGAVKTPSGWVAFCSPSRSAELPAPVSPSPGLRISFRLPPAPGASASSSAGVAAVPPVAAPLAGASAPGAPLAPSASAVAAAAAPVLPVDTPRSPLVEESEEEEEEEESEKEEEPVRRSSQKRKAVRPPTASDDDDDDDDDDDGVDDHVSLLRVCCLRCAKYLAVKPEFSCVFPATHTKCTRCTRLKDKCVPVPDSVVASVSALLALQRDFDVAKGAVATALRSQVVAAARALPVEVRVAASLQVPAGEVNAAILRGQAEMLAVLCRIDATSVAPTAQVGRGRGKVGQGDSDLLGGHVPAPVSPSPLGLPCGVGNDHRTQECGHGERKYSYYRPEGRIKLRPEGES